MRVRSFDGSFVPWRPWVAVALALLAALPPALPAQSPQVTGKVTAQENGEALSDVRVIVLGTSIFAITNAQGNFTLRGLSPGNYDVRVLRVGYQEQKKTVAVTAAGGATLNFAMVRTVVQLQAVVTTATGEQRRVELGNSVASIDAVKRIEESPMQSMGDLLVAKAAGVQVLPNNMTGGGSRVRIRGTSSISLSNDPIYIIDGIRMTSNSSSTAIGVGGTAPSRVNDLNPEEIENIEIVKGPSAATLYGTDAANGVIVITTRKGRAGRAQWSVFSDYGVIRDRNDYPAMHALLGKSPGATTQRKCLLKELSLNTCVLDSAVSLNVFAEDDLTPIKDGNRGQFGAQLQGGTDAIRYFLSGDFENEIGPFGFPEFDRPRFAASKIAIRDEWERPNALRKGSYRANLNLAATPQLDLSVQAGYTNLRQRLPQVDNNVNSFWYNGMVGPGYRVGPGYTGKGSLGQELGGYAAYTPGDIFQDWTGQRIQRMIGSSSVNWRPTSWLQNRADVGVDLTSRLDQELCRLSQCADFGTNRQGFSDDQRASIRNFTVNLGSTGSWQALDWLSVKSTGGVQYVNYLFDANRALGEQLPPGASTPGAGTIPTAGASTVITKTLGLFIEEAVAIRDRLFLTAAIRTDQNSAFGTNFQRVYYPKGAVSWIMSQESFFPQASWLDEMRVRASYGAAGVQPGPNDADRTFAVNTTNIAGTDIAGLRSSQLGNQNLKPERSAEFETGFDLRMFDSRVSVEATYYSKKTKDALVNRIIAPSAGSAATSQLSNLASVRNWGYEGLINAQLVSRRMFGWDITLNGSHMSNELLSLGRDAAGKPIPTIGTGTIRQAEGYPLNSTWTRRFAWGDANNDKIITPNEVVVDTAFRYLGYSQPRLEVAITNGIDLFNRRLRFVALVDRKSGYFVQNNEQSFLCQQSTSCRATSTLNPSLFEQARAIAVRDGLPSTPHGYFERPDFWRIREVSATYNLPESFTSRWFKVRSASFNLAARNLAVFTDWTGVDPEQNYSQGDTQATLLTAGPPTYVTARLFLRF
jgi:TonB-linked SusC/RagA family outer membrane protein